MVKFAEKFLLQFRKNLKAAVTHLLITQNVIRPPPNPSFFLLLLLLPFNCDLVFFAATAVKLLRHSIIRLGTGYSGYFVSHCLKLKSKGDAIQPALVTYIVIMYLHTSITRLKKTHVLSTSVPVYLVYSKMLESKIGLCMLYDL